MEISDSAQYQEPDSLPFIVDIGKSPLHRKQAPSASPCLPLEQLTTPEVQKVVVEHVIKNSELSPHYYGHVKLRPFSGKIPCPHMESDYDTWRSNVEFHLTDATLSARHVLQAQVASLKASLSGNSNQTPTKKARPKAKVSTEENTLCSGDLKLTKKPRPGYCFKCGEDGHIASSCSNEPNYDLVEIKRNQFKQKQKTWEKQNKHDLN
ncbi:zinc finger CCHC domain-containing protein 12-like [Tachysurus ichikawai]